MHLEDRDRRLRPLPLRSPAEPVAVAPFVAVDVGDLGRRGRPKLHGEADGVGLVEPLAVRCADFVLVERSGPDVEVADEVDVVRVRRPNGETGAGHPFVLRQVGAEDLEDPCIVAAREAGDPLRVQDR